ncbi:helix-turn-helix domain-containing protein [Ruminococcus sp.]|uniref:helix-turn-helix domain-containing protein n=1 Tax=Ruminococcus sp. TaxID=41978 RepID=UPI0038677CC3
MNELTNRVIEVRKSEGLNQRQFAEKLDLSTNFINQCENGKREFSERTIKDIASTFKINLEWLRTGEGEMYDEESEEVVLEALKAEYGLDDKDIEIIQAYIHMVPLEREVFKNFIKNVQNKKEL